MTKTGKITKHDLINALLDYAMPNDVELPRWSGGVDSFKRIIYSALCYDHTTKDMYFRFCEKAGLLSTLRKKQEEFISQENIKRDLESKPKIKFEPKDDYSDMLQLTEKSEFDIIQPSINK